MNQHIRPSPRPRRYSDNLSHAGAEGLANTIRLFWAAKGKFPIVTLEKISVASVEGGSGMFCVRSNMTNGAPQ